MKQSVTTIATIDAMRETLSAYSDAMTIDDCAITVAQHRALWSAYKALVRAALAVRK